MPGKGRPFVPNDPRHRPGPGRPKLEYLEAMRSLAPEAVEVLRQELKDKRHRLHAAESILNRAYGKPTETVAMEQDGPRYPGMDSEILEAMLALRKEALAKKKLIVK